MFPVTPDACWAVNGGWFLVSCGTNLAAGSNCYSQHQPAALFLEQPLHNVGDSSWAGLLLGLLLLYIRCMPWLFDWHGTVLCDVWAVSAGPLHVLKRAALHHQLATVAYWGGARGSRLVP
jgi:hypothetical protein